MDCLSWHNPCLRGTIPGNILEVPLQVCIAYHPAYPTQDQPCCWGLVLANIRHIYLQSSYLYYIIFEKSTIVYSLSNTKLLFLFESNNGICIQTYWHKMNVMWELCLLPLESNCDPHPTELPLYCHTRKGIDVHLCRTCTRHTSTLVPGLTVYSRYSAPLCSHTDASYYLTATANASKIPVAINKKLLWVIKYITAVTTAAIINMIETVGLYGIFNYPHHSTGLSVLFKHRL